MREPKVYVVTEGEYSGYHIVAVFKTKAAAEEFARKDGYAEVETYDLLEVVPQRTKRYFMSLELSGEVREWDIEYWAYEMSAKDKLPATVQDDAWFRLNHWYGKTPTPNEALAQGFPPFAIAQPSGHIVLLRLKVSGVDKEAVRKVFYDRLAQRKAEAEGVAA